MPSVATPAEVKRTQLLASTAEVRTNHWAVFRSLKMNKSCRLTTLHKTKAEAIERARDLAAELFTTGSQEFTYFVVKVEHEVGLSQGRIFDNGI